MTEGVLVAADDAPRWPDRPPGRPFPRPWASRLRAGRLRASLPWASRLRSSLPRAGLPWAGQLRGARVSRLAGKAVIGAGLLAYCWYAAGSLPFTRNALLVVLVPGAVAGLLAFGRPPRRIPPPERLDVVGFSYWGIAVAALFEWEASAFKDGASWWHPALTTLIDPTLEARPVKAVGILLWLLAGWGLVRR